MNGRDALHNGGRALDTMYTWGDDIAHACLHILVDAGSQTMEGRSCYMVIVNIYVIIVIIIVIDIDSHWHWY